MPEPQSFTIAVVLLLASAFFTFVSVSHKRRTRLAPVAAVKSLVLSVVFATLSFVPLPTWRAEVLANMVPELLFNLLLSSICLAQARSSFVAASRRPRLRTILAAAPLVLLGSWLLALVVGLVWPFPALQAFEPAGTAFLVFRWSIVIPQGLYSAAIGWLFLEAAMQAPAFRLRLKNLFFVGGSFAWFLQTMNSAAHGAARVMLADGVREIVVLPLMLAERFLLPASVVAFTAGLTLRYAPTVNETLVRRAYPALLRLRESFESRRWHLVSGGKVRRLAQASYYAMEAGDLMKLPDADLEKARMTLELTAILTNPGEDSGDITPEKARKLLTLQERIMGDDYLASMVKWPTVWDGDHGGYGDETVASAPLHEALEAALYIAFPAKGTPPKGSENSAWYHLAAVAVEDVRMMTTEQDGDGAESGSTRRRVVHAYRAAKTSATVSYAARG